MRTGDRRRATGFFFFQAEDGIRDVAVTGVQTCALPILLDDARGLRVGWTETNGASSLRSPAGKARQDRSTGTQDGARVTPREGGSAQRTTRRRSTAHRNGSRCAPPFQGLLRSEEHTSELQSRLHLVCRLLLVKTNSTLD